MEEGFENGAIFVGVIYVSSLTSIISDVPGNVNSQDDFKVWGVLYKNMTNA